MRNEWLLLLSVILLYGLVLLFYKCFGKQGLFCWTVLATIAANIEVLLVIRAFGFEQTLGNVMFASSFLVTDILSENYSQKDANRAVHIGIVTSMAFVLISQLWLLFEPAETDWAMPAIRDIFSNTPRLMLVSLLVYIICQKFDVWAYHRWWKLTSRLCGDEKRFLWLRNNGSTLISQLLNSVLFTLGAFAGVYEWSTLLSLCLFSYLVFICTSLLDTPVVYLARMIRQKQLKKETE